jgi:hypothetical protein
MTNDQADKILRELKAIKQILIVGLLAWLGWQAGKAIIEIAMGPLPIVQLVK